jgi:hypothetical protein
MNLKFLLCAICIVAATGQSFTQVIKIDTTTNWRKTFKAGLNLNQATFSSNWKGGGVNSIGFNALLHVKANYKKDKNSWDNEMDLLYGMVNNKGQGYRKTLDRIYWDTKYGRKLSERWSFTTSLNLLTQFAEGYKYTPDANKVEQATLISDFLAPAFITSSVGFQYKPNEFFQLRISPAAPRLTIVKDIKRFVTEANPTPFGVDSTESTRFEFLAFQLVAEFNKDIAKNLNLKWRYLLFANYETFKAKTIDQRLDINLTAKVNSFINVSIGSIILYDFDQDSEVQLSQALNLGILYTFQNYEDKKK